MAGRISHPDASWQNVQLLAEISAASLSNDEMFEMASGAGMCHIEFILVFVFPDRVLFAIESS